jgi:hypothetical protein
VAPRVRKVRGAQALETRKVHAVRSGGGEGLRGEEGERGAVEVGV